MTRSASTPRLRLTLLYFVALLVATALCAPRHPPGALLQAAALLLVAGACLGRIWCSVFIAGRKDAAIVTHGPYALCRHPLYSLSFVGGIGLALATGSFTLVAATAIVLAALFGSAARREERWLGERHPGEYTRYAASTPRWWPAFSRWSMPAETLVYPPILWKAFVDAGSFFLLYALVLAAGALQGSGVLPRLAVLP
ncbi:MAG TPA: isoprenylcysteine carboxylmethyltransferase family protein [Steroidobacteraceae bacterium]|jgi:protein-S-isoprenylcysteine O-methyltransferase Ste14|nr:isoprenylcysteine carboxylmethyltransferase family protein [Steroidobacteraceae bacterium]HNS28406.1 isoprenylcysteine carboxylmethyltransferase family protein [Steroidobacteraceae bacterium]